MDDRSLVILLVEDNAADAALLELALVESHYGRFEVAQARRLAEAMLRLASARFDAVLLDLGLPDSQGLDTLDRLRSGAASTPIIVLTGLADQELALRAMQHGAQDYLLKSDVERGLVGRVVRYVVERKAAEDAVKAREAELAHLWRISAMGQMASGLAHELNQPLGAILNYAGVCQLELESAGVSAPRALKALNELMNETRRAGQIIDRMRQFVRKQRPRTQAVDVNQLAERALGLMRFELRRRNVRAALEIAADLPPVRADEIQIEQVLVNLIYNAAEAMEHSPDGSTVTVRTALDEDSGQVCVTVIDNGPGMSREALGRLFEPFFTTKPKGLGMGLNISRSIIESHGGRLTAALAGPDELNQDSAQSLLPPSPSSGIPGEGRGGGLSRSCSAKAIDLNQDRTPPSGMRFTFTLPVELGITPCCTNQSGNQVASQVENQAASP